jgi:hypothetical protein
MNSKSITYDLDDWEMISDTENKNLETDEASSFIYNKITENIFNENWYIYSEDIIKNINLTEEINTIDSQQECIKNDKKRNLAWENKRIDEIIKDAKERWSIKIKNSQDEEKSSLEEHVNNAMLIKQNVLSEHNKVKKIKTA